MNWYCPVFRSEIDDGDCFDCALAAENSGSQLTADRMQAANPDFESICLKCKYHPVME